METSHFRLLSLLSSQVQAAPWHWSFSKKQLSTTSYFFKVLNLPEGNETLSLKSIVALCQQYLNETQRYSMYEAVRESFLGGDTFTLRFLIHFPGNQKKWVRVFGHPVKEKGAVIGIDGIIQNISDRKAMEDEFEKTQFALEKANILIFQLLLNGKIEFANELAITTLKSQKPTLLQKFFHQIELQFNATGWQKHANQLKRKMHFRQSGFLVNSDGATIPVLMDFVYFGRLNREAIYVFAQDQSHIKIQEKELYKAHTELTHLQSQMEVEKLEATDFTPLPGLQKIVTKNQSYRKMLRQLVQVAPTDSTVLILGETGTGKELLADALYELSHRKEKPFIKVNCATLPEHLVESELFGHEKGAFTSAINRRTGRFELAHQGSIFLDEIAELPLDLQAKLLRVLQEGSFERIGGTATIQVDVRIIAATNRNLAELVNKGKFRRDLYYRLNVFPLENMPLRQRKDDIPILVKHFLKKYSNRLQKQVNSVNTNTFQQLQTYDFPGNIRELENLIERGVILAKTNVLKLDTIATEIDKRTASFKSFEAMQRAHILEALQLTNWRISGEHGAAKLLEMNAKTLESKMRKLGVQRPKVLR